jgi:hypothetical protein
VASAEASVSLSTPVLFVVFNQPDITSRVFEEIRKARPRQLFIAADGARGDRPGEAAECEETRRVVTRIDWDCDVHTNFRETNVGSRQAVSSAVSWFLDSVGEGIILEYDCLPDPSFFPFCEAMLDRYRHDARVMAISGTNSQLGRRRGVASYYFSRIPTAWGWASWQRAWRFWDGDVPSFPEFERNECIRSLFRDQHLQRFWLRKFRDVYSGLNTTTWGFAWVYAVFAQGGLCVTPNANLISNIGFSPRATHAKDTRHRFASLPTETLDVRGLTHPRFVVADPEADEYFSRELMRTERGPLTRRFVGQVLRVGRRLTPERYREPVKRLLGLARPDEAVVEGTQR